MKLEATWGPKPVPSRRKVEKKGVQEIMRKSDATRRADTVATHCKRRLFWGERGETGGSLFQYFDPCITNRVTTPCTYRVRRKIDVKFGIEEGSFRGGLVAK